MNGEIYKNARIATYINQDQNNLKMEKEDGKFDTSNDTSEKDSLGELKYYQAQDKIMDKILGEEGREVIEYYDNLSIDKKIQQPPKEWEMDKVDKNNF